MTVGQEAGIPSGELSEFLAHLEVRGASSYTLRSYRLGLNDFSRWLAESARPFHEVRRRDIEDYIHAFASAKGRRTSRSPDEAQVVDLATRSPRPSRSGGGRAPRHGQPPPERARLLLQLPGNPGC